MNSAVFCMCMRWGMSQANWWADLVIMTLLTAVQRYVLFKPCLQTYWLQIPKFLLSRRKIAFYYQMLHIFTLCYQKLLRVRPGAFPLVFK